MLITSSQIARYGISNIFAGYASVDYLFSGEGSDPYAAADSHAGAITNGQYFDITVAICAGNKVETQIIVFKNKAGWERYVRDGVKCYDCKE